MRRPSLALALAALTGGCAVGPHYRAPPSAPSAAAPFVSRSANLDPASDLPPRWWSLFADPALDALVAEALAHNSDLRVAAANVERAQAVLTGARGLLLPTTQLSGGVTRSRTSTTATTTTGAGTSSGGTGSTGTDATGTGASGSAGSTGSGTTSGSSLGTVSSDRARTLYRGGAQLSYEVDLFGRVRRTIESARADVAAAEATRDATRVTVAAATTQAYVDVCTIGARIQVAQQSLDLVAQSYALTAKQRDLGGASDYEVSRVAVLVEQTRATIPQLQSLQAEALFDLATLVGRPPSALPPETVSCHAMPQPRRPLPIGDGSALLRRRPDIRAAERTLASDVAGVGVATADLFPTVTLGASVNAAGTGLKSALSRSGVAFSFGPLISWFFPDIVAARARIEQAGATARASLARYDGTILTALGEAEKALAAYDAELRRNADLAAAETASRRAYDLSAVRVRYGTISQLEQLDVQRDLISAVAARAESDYTLAQNQIAVFRTLGGGWEDAPAIDPTPRAIDGTGGLTLKRSQP